MANFFKQYSTLTSGTITVQDSGQDVCIIHNAGSLAATLTVTFPASPIDGQQVTMASTLGVTVLTLSSGLTIIGALTAIAATGFATWVYDKTANKWCRIG